MNTVGIDKHIEDFYNSLRIRYPNQITSTHENNSTDLQHIYGRENAQQQLLDALQHNYVNINSPHQHEHKICTALGFYGLGKTAVGTEVASQLIFNNRPVKHAIVDFESMVDGIDSQHLVDYNTFSTHLSMRVLSRLITGKIYRHVISNSDSFDFLVKDLKDNILDLNTILRFYGEKENVAAFVIQFDKLNHLTMQARQYLLEYIGNAFSPQNGQPVLFLPLITGSSCLFERVVDRSPFAHEKLLLNAIPQQSIEEMVTTRTTLDEALVTRVKGSFKFQMLAKTTLGVPRIVRRLAEAMAKGDLVKIQDFKELIANISSEFVNGAGRMYSISQWTNWYPGENSVLKLLALILRGEICLTGHINETDVSVTVRLPGIPNEMKGLPGTQLSLILIISH